MWAGIDPTVDSVSSQLGATFPKGRWEPVTKEGANHLSKVRGFVVLRIPTKFREVLVQTLKHRHSNVKER